MSTAEHSAHDVHGRGAPARGGAEHAGHGHVVPLRGYLAVFGALLVLTAVTTGIAFVDLGRWNTLVAMTIAISKALLVALYFMHLRWSGKIVVIFAVASIGWLVFLFGLTLGDYLTRLTLSGWAG